jgi:hypothetical protein
MGALVNMSWNCHRTAISTYCGFKSEPDRKYAEQCACSNYE